MKFLEYCLPKNGSLAHKAPTIAILLKFAIALLILWAVVKSSLYAQVHVDAGYYLSAAKTIYKGILPNKGYREYYMPLALYIYAGVYVLFGASADYSCFMFITYAFTVASAGILAFMIYQQTKDSIFAWLVGLLVFLFIYYSEGTLIILEPFTLFFGVLGYFFFFRRTRVDIFIAGFCIALSFFCKQYGILYILILGLSLLIQKDIKGAFVLSFGFAFGLVVFTAIHLWILGLKTEDYISFFWNSSYGDRRAASFINKFGGFLKYYRIYIALIGAIVAYLILKRKEILPSIKPNLAESLLIGAGTIQLLTLAIPQYFIPHYAILILPFWVAGVALYLYRVVAFKHWVLLLYLFVSLIVVNVSLREILYGLNLTLRKRQYEQGALINTYIPKEGKTYIDDTELERYRVTSNLASPNLQKYGFIFSNVLDDKNRRLYLDAADYVLSSDGDPVYEAAGFRKVYGGELFTIYSKVQHSKE